MVSGGFRPGRQIIWINSDAVPTDQAGREAQEVPLCAGGFQHVLGADAETVKYDCQLVHQRDVQIALRVLITFAASASRTFGARCTPAGMIDE
jgi:hypothetical protein